MTLKKIASWIEVVIVPVILIVIFSLITSGFGIHSIPTILKQCAIPLLIGFGLYITMQTGMFDFSVGIRVIFAGLIGATLESRFGSVGLVIGCVAGGVIGGVVIGLLYRYLRIPSMVAALGFVLIFEVISNRLAGGKGILRISMKSAIVGSYPYNLVIAFIACVILFLIIYHSKAGFAIKAVGNNERLVMSIGMNAAHIKFIAWVISGIFCGLGGILQTCYSLSITAMIGLHSLDLVFKPLIGVLIGMQLAKIRDNLPLMIFIGELIIAIIFNGFIAMGFSDIAQNIVLGVFLLGVMAVSSLGITRNSIVKRKVDYKQVPAQLKR